MVILLPPPLREDLGLGERVEELGDVIDRFEETAHDVVNVRDGRVVKLIGDEVMFVAVDAAAGCDIA